MLYNSYNEVDSFTANAEGRAEKRKHLAPAQSRVIQLEFINTLPSSVIPRDPLADTKASWLRMANEYAEAPSAMIAAAKKQEGN